MSGDVSLPAGTTPAGRVVLDNLTGKVLAARRGAIEVRETLTSMPAGTVLTDGELDRLIGDLASLEQTVGFARARAERLRGPQ